MPNIDDCRICNVDTVNKQITVWPCINGTRYDFKENGTDYFIEKSGILPSSYKEEYVISKNGSDNMKTESFSDNIESKPELEKHKKESFSNIEKQALKTFDEMLRLMVLEKESLLKQEGAEKAVKDIDYADKKYHEILDQIKK